MRNPNNKYFCLQNSSIFALLFLSLLFHHTLLISGNSPSLLIDNITLDCGSASEGHARDGRIWSADANSTFLLLDPTNASKISSAVKSPMNDAVPYITVRLSRFEFTYVFPVTFGTKFIRLYFYPSSYPDFSSSIPFFSVKANRYTLLSNFSSAPNAQDAGLDGFVKEFCLNVEDGETLNVTFAPTPGVTDAYAFVNGIEIASMPTKLYYTDEGFKFVGSWNNESSLESNTALELMYRINVGGQFIEPQNDTARMFRSWNSDNEYLSIAEPSALLYNNTIQLKYRSNIAHFAAPDGVYQTARSMGMNKKTNENYNLTWDFQNFYIYIATQIAESKADVIAWSGGNGFPVFKDYAVTIEPEGNERVQNISIALHPRPEMSGYSDAILNGLEIFKLSNADNLAAPNPDIPPINPPTAATTSPTSTKSNKNRTTIGAIVGGAVSGFLVLSFLLF
ncbi:hypothetical protein GH714_031368 [Hevea brasiliensis]|uniref:Malectin-like domain-containing protein n=1 Tax=Hevea brasiliensis TaxID=3981 RepID=A0A6A6LFP5_HEVBR|nr:hypothetical protein GH714_031368 [Hevea brasiliensis]